MHYPKVLERVGFPEQIFHRSFSLGAPVKIGPQSVLWLEWIPSRSLITAKRTLISQGAVSREGKCATQAIF